MVFELDKASNEYGYDDFRNFYGKKINDAKIARLVLKITSCFAKKFLKGFNVEFDTLIDNPASTERFLLNAQVENLFEYSKYVLSTMRMHMIFHHALIIDAGSLDLLNKLISISKGNVFIFESDNKESSSRIEQYLQNNHNIFFKKYQLKKLSDAHIQSYIQQLIIELKLKAEDIDSTILTESIERGNLTEIASILKDYNDRLQKDKSIKIRSIREIIQCLSTSQNAALTLIALTNGKIDLNELTNIINELSYTFSEDDIDFLLSKKLIERNGEYISLQSFVYEELIREDCLPSLKYAVASALVKYLNTMLGKNYDNKYLDILVDYYLDNKMFNQLYSLLDFWGKRLDQFNTQAERVEYFQKFVGIRQQLYDNNRNFATIFAQIAYNANLYFQAMDFIRLVKNEDNDVVFMKAIILNRCESFNQSKEYICEKIKSINKGSSLYFKLSLILMMDLIQLNEKKGAKDIFDELKSYTGETLYSYLIRLSNVFHSDFGERLNIVQSITSDFYKTNDKEFSGLHAIYLAYLYALNGQSESAEEELSEAREFFGENLIYNHMILHNEATIKFHNQEIDEEIPTLLNNAKVTAYDVYDQFAIYNNLLVYYILSDKLSSLECQNTALELEKMIDNTGFKRFVGKIYYNLYFYYTKMYNYEKVEYYRKKLDETDMQYSNTYKYKLIYETSWKLPIS